MTKLLILGNCQTAGLAALINAMAVEDVTATGVVFDSEMMKRIVAGEIDFSSLMSTSDLIFFHPLARIVQLIEQCCHQKRSEIRSVPRIFSSAYHPDFAFITKRGAGKIRSSLGGEYHSSLAIYGWIHGLCVAETTGLFCEEVFEHLGYFEYWNSSKEAFGTLEKETGMPLVSLFDRWSSMGCWMHTPIHPKLFVLADLAREMLKREGIPFVADVERSVVDKLESGAVLPVYPEIGSRLGVTGDYLFKLRVTSDPPGWRKVNLEDFVAASFELFSRHPKEDLTCERLNSSRYQSLGDFLKHRRNTLSDQIPTSPAGEVGRPSRTVGNPYRDLPDYQFWRRAIERLPADAVNPVVRPRFNLNRKDKIATAGSCFAQHISETLRKSGFNYYVTEANPNLPDEEAKRLNFGRFSARFGNIYTARQLLQLFERAYGTFTPTDQYWLRSDKRLVDPFRPQIEPEGFSTINELQASKARHFEFVREMFECLDVFIFTLGLTEAWRNREDGAIYPLAPGVSGGEFDASLHEFVNFRVSEVVADMQSFIQKLLGVNPRSRIILTVSPVPLVATYEKRHVLVANTYSKSVLRVAAEQITRRNRMCDYFPSYEIISGPFSRGRYFADDLRSITADGVDHVMRVFLSHYASKSDARFLNQKILMRNAPMSELKSDTRSFKEELMQENTAMSEVVCDEEALDPS